MKKFDSIMQLIQIAIYAVLAALAIIGCIFSIYQCGHFEWWQVGYGIFAVVLTWLVYAQAKEFHDNNK